jgi:hypothetical protein
MRYVIIIGALLVLAWAAPAKDEWVMFQGQVNGPVTTTTADPLDAFRHKQLKGVFWGEGYYHHMNFPDGSMVTVSVGFDLTQASVIFVLGRPGQKAFRDYQFIANDQVKFDADGFGMTVGGNRLWLKGDKYFMHVELERVKADISYEILAPAAVYGDGKVVYPDGKYYSIYTLPIPWARAKVEAVCDGKKYSLQGFGNMNRDNQVLSPVDFQARWRVFWFFGDDHALAVTDYNTHQDYGSKLVQRLVFAEPGGRMFVSTSYDLTWDDWEEVPEIRFRFPRHYSLHAEGGGAVLAADVRVSELILKEDLYSNLPSSLELAKHFFRNGWTFDSWCDYTLTYTRDKTTRSFKGRGVGRWMNLEEEK